MSRVLIVEDEPEMGELLSQILTDSGYACTRAINGLAALAQASQCDLVLADVMMPVMNGFDMVEQMRQQGQRIPIIFLTAKDTTKDLVRGLELGGDDYLVKPFKLEELLARVKVALRRARDSANQLAWNEFTMDCGKRTAYRDGIEIFLSPTQFSLLELFMRHPETVISKSHILEQIWADDGYRRENIVETYINYLRVRTEVRGAPRVIHTVRRRGYVLAKIGLES